MTVARTRQRRDVCHEALRMRMWARLILERRAQYLHEHADLSYRHALKCLDVQRCTLLRNRHSFSSKSLCTSTANSRSANRLSRPLSFASSGAPPHASPSHRRHCASGGTYARRCSVCGSPSLAAHPTQREDRDDVFSSMVNWVSSCPLLRTTKTSQLVELPRRMTMFLLAVILYVHAHHEREMALPIHVDWPYRLNIAWITYC